MGSDKNIVLNRMSPKFLTIQLEGITPLICHRKSEKLKKELEDKHAGKGKKMREVRNPQQEFEASLYPHPDGGYGFPAIAFKQAVIRAAKYYPEFDMTQMRGAFHVLDELVKIKGGKPTMRSDFVNVQGKLDMRYRGMFGKWEVELTVKYIEGMVTKEQIVNLFEAAGTIAGVGEWRPTSPKSTGNFGMFKVKGKEIK